MPRSPQPRSHREVSPCSSERSSRTTWHDSPNSPSTPSGPSSRTPSARCSTDSSSPPCTIDWRGDYREQLPTLHDPAAHKYVAVAESAAGVITGYVAWRADPARRHGEITLLAVDRAHRAGGTGTALCEHAFADLRGRGAKLVEIGTGGDSFHTPARALYESLGCVPFPTVYYYRRL